MYNILIPALVLGGAGMILGIIFSITERIDITYEKIISDEQDLDSLDKKTARVLCAGDNSRCQKKYEFDVTLKSCAAAVLLYKGDKKCSYACVGYGDCKNVCPHNAIEINEKGVAVVLEEKCKACEKCMLICPSKVIKILPYKGKFTVLCSSKDKGQASIRNCEVACISCSLCAKNCPVKAIEVDGNLAVIDSLKCINCGICELKCPTNAINSEIKEKRKAKINEEKCIGCMKCMEVCPTEAIDGELKQKHKIHGEDCVGCGLCEKQCPVNAINMTMEIVKK